METEGTGNTDNRKYWEPGTLETGNTGNWEHREMETEGTGNTDNRKYWEPGTLVCFILGSCSFSTAADILLDCCVFVDERQETVGVLEQIDWAGVRVRGVTAVCTEEVERVHLRLNAARDPLMG
ncbi:uncharacterized [Tachysurus ichikawai]